MITVSNLQKRFGKTEAVRGLNFELADVIQTGY